MKKLLFFICLIFSFVAIQTEVKAQVYSLNTVDIDTLTNADTVLNTVTGRPYPFYYEVHITATSLSGTLLDTVYIQQAARGTTDWITLASQALAATTGGNLFIKTGNCLGGNLRIYTKSTGTQSTRIKTSTQIYKKPT